MNDRLSAKHRMFGQVGLVCGGYSYVWQVNPAFARAVARFNDAKDGIDRTNTLLQGDDSGSTEAKSKKRETMAKLATVVAGGLLAYASESKNVELKREANISKDDIMKAKETDADDLALLIWQLGAKHFAALGDYGITQDDLNALKASIENFTEKIGAPRLGQNARKQIGEQQREFFDIADEVLNDTLDNLIHKFEDTHKEFYNAYQSARDIIRQGGSKIPQGAKQPKPETVA